MRSRTKVLIFVILCFILLAGALFSFFISSYPLEKFIIYKVQKEHPDLKIASLTIQKHSISRKKTLVIENLSAVVDHDDWPRNELSIKEITVFDLPSLWEAPQATKIRLHGVNISNDELSVSNGYSELHFQSLEKKWDLLGHVNIESVMLGSQTYSTISSRLYVNESKLHFENIIFQTARGSVKGEFVLEYDQDFSYIMDIVFEDVLMQELKLHDQLEGLVRGHLKVFGDIHNIKSIESHLEAPQGVHMNARMLAPLLNYIPQSIQKKQIQEIMAKNKNIYVDSFKIDVIEGSNEIIKTQVDLKSAEYNLDVNLGVDINVEGGIMALVHQGMGQLLKEAK